MMNSASLKEYNIRAERARRNFRNFIEYTKPDYKFNWHHDSICDKLQQFSKGIIKKLMIFVPPQHGKSELATRRFPSYVLGIDPNRKIAICSYSSTIASTFNRDIQRIIDDRPYSEVFPMTTLNENSAINPSKNAYLRNSETFEIIGHQGFVKTVGVGGSLTGTPVDLGIIDDPFKDREEAMSTTIREKVYNWYTDVFSTRLHNDSQQLLIMTRWHQDDLAGRILQTDSDWDVITYQAIKDKDLPNDPRNKGDALWPEKHSLERLLKIKQDTPVTFNSLYQQEPRISEEDLVFPVWAEIDQMPNYNQVFGIDFGFTNDPTAIIEVQKHNKTMYVREWLYKKGLINSEIIEFIKNNLPKGCLIVADSAEPKTITEMQRAGLKVRGAIKGKDSILFGINYIRDHALFVHSKSYNLKEEMRNFQIGIDGFDHLIDGWRYAATTPVSSPPMAHIPNISRR